MAAILLAPRLVALDGAGGTLSGAKAYFYLTGSTTDAAVFNDGDLASPSHEHAQPVAADSDGTFPPIWLDSDVTYRMVLKTSAGEALNNGDVDPVNPESDAVVLDADEIVGLTAAHVTTALGFTPPDKAGDTMTGLKLATGGLAVAAAGDAGFRHIVWNTQNAAYSIALNDAGEGLLHTDSNAHTWTIQPQSAVIWPTGAHIRLRNNGSGVVTVARGSGVVLRASASGTDANKALAQWGYAELIREASDVWFLHGVGVT